MSPWLISMRDRDHVKSDLLAFETKVYKSACPEFTLKLTKLSLSGFYTLTSGTKGTRWSWINTFPQDRKSSTEDTKRNVCTCFFSLQRQRSLVLAYNRTHRKASGDGIKRSSAKRRSFSAPSYGRPLSPGSSHCDELNKHCPTPGRELRSGEKPACQIQCGLIILFTVRAKYRKPQCNSRVNKHTSVKAPLLSIDLAQAVEWGIAGAASAEAWGHHPRVIAL